MLRPKKKKKRKGNNIAVNELRERERGKKRGITQILCRAVRFQKICDHCGAKGDSRGQVGEVTAEKQTLKVTRRATRKPRARVSERQGRLRPKHSLLLSFAA